MNWFSRLIKNSAQGKGLSLGIEWGVDFLNVALVNTAAAKPEIIAKSQLRAQSHELLGVQLKQWVLNQKIQNIACRWVLSVDAYQLLMVEPPDVPEAEWRQALKWRIKDLIHYPVDQVVLDIFTVPNDIQKAGKKWLYVAVCEKSKIKTIVDWTKEAGLMLESIDIVELSLRNLMVSLDDKKSTRSMALARIQKGSASIYIYRQGSLLLVRNFAIQYSGGMAESLPEEALGLELQRSLDYFERQLGQAPPASLILVGLNIHQDKLGPILKSSLAPTLRALALNEIFEEETRLEDGLIYGDHVVALGAAIRSDSLIQYATN